MSQKVTVEEWVQRFRACGLDDAGMKRRHREFEQWAPQAHHDFLLGCGIPEPEIRRIRP